MHSGPLRVHTVYARLNVGVLLFTLASFYRLFSVQSINLECNTEVCIPSGERLLPPQVGQRIRLARRHT